MILASDIPLSLWLGIPTAAAYALTALIGPRVAANMGHRLLSVPWAMHGLGLVFALFAPQIGGVRFGFAPALSVTAWLMLTFYVLEQHWFPQLRTRWTLSIVGAAVVVLAAVFLVRCCTHKPHRGCRCTWLWAWPLMVCLLRLSCTLC